MPGIRIEHVMLKYLKNHKSGGRGPLDSKNVDTFPYSVRFKWRENDHFLYSFSTIYLHRKFCFGLTGSLIKLSKVSVLS